jgi:predicted alpha/beta superfamily hydrolase
MTSLPIRAWMIVFSILLIFSGCSQHTPLNKQFTLKSDYSLTGEFVISVKLPSHYYETNKDYPVFYMTDADWFFGIATDMAYGMEMGQVDFILVGIGYGDKVACREKRLKDLGSDLNADGVPAYTLYQSFLKEELFPAIEKRFRAASTNRTYCGWSLGALYANHMLYEQRDLFDNYILGGTRFPLDWPKHMKNSVRQPSNDRPISLYVGLPEKDATREEYIAMINSLKNEDFGDIFLRWEIYAGQGHDFESAADVITKGMDYTFAPKQLTPALLYRVERDGLETALQHFEAWKIQRPDLADYSPANLLDFSKYLSLDDNQKFMAYFARTYPPKQVTFRLNSKTVPVENAVYITGNHPNLGFWDPSVAALRKFPDGHWEKSIGVLCGTSLEYKFTLGSWETEALDESGQTLPNFHLTVEKDSVITVEIPGWKSIDN